MYIYLGLLFTVVIGLICLSAIYNVSASITIYIAKKNYGLYISKLIQAPYFPWTLILLALSVLVRTTFIGIVIYEFAPTYIMVLYTTSDLLYGIGTIFSAFMIGMMTNNITTKTKNCKNNKDINKLTFDYSNLVDALGPHLLSILSVAVLRITLSIYGSVKFITGCSGMEDYLSTVCLIGILFVDVQVILFYCCTLHHCNATFKNVAGKLR